MKLTYTARSCDIMLDHERQQHRTKSTFFLNEAFCAALPIARDGARQRSNGVSVLHKYLIQFFGQGSSNKVEAVHFFLPIFRSSQSDILFIYFFFFFILVLHHKKCTLLVLAQTFYFFVPS